MSEKQNIVMVSWDSVRADHTSFDGYERDTTPFTDRMAEEGVVFENTQVPAVGTPASFTGTFTGEHSTANMLNPNPQHWQESLSDRKILPEILQENGYYTGGFHFNALMSSQFGWNRGWNVYEDHMWDDKGGMGPDDSGEESLKSKLYDILQEHDMAQFAVHSKKMLQGDPPAHWTKMWDEIEDFIENAPEPWFLWVLLIDTHHPYLVPPEERNWKQPGNRQTYMWNFVMRRYRDVVGERRQSIVNSYDNTIRWADKFNEELSQKLMDEGYGDIPFIFHSDHGDEFGEHGNYGHRPLMYDTVTRVPLVMKNVGKRGVVEGPNTLLDLPSTILDIANIDDHNIERPSLLSDENSDHDSVKVQNLLGEHGKTVCIVGEEWKVMYHPNGEWGHGIDFGQEGSFEAYHTLTDPFEKDNRFDEAPEELVERLYSELDKDDKITHSTDGEMTDEAKERLADLGYLE